MMRSGQLIDHGTLLMIDVLLKSKLISTLNIMNCTIVNVSVDAVHIPSTAEAKYIKTYKR